jgi:ssDNA-binding Zn-finger/Zn-ribbon topoisomerase 1
MRLRRPNPGQAWEPFWGCGRYPACKGTRNIDFETGAAESDDDIDAREELKKDYAADY